MPRRSLSPSRPHRRSRRAVFWPGFFIPPLAVIAIGLLLTHAMNRFEASQPWQVRTGSTNSGALAPFYTHSVYYWQDAIETWADAYQLDPNLIATVMQIESCGDPGAESPAGASGLFQVMPFHFVDGEDAFDPETNAQRGLAYLRQALDQTGGDVRLALAGYNGGLGVTAAAEADWPDETRRYADWGSGIYQEATQGLTESATLDAWLTHGGWRLCAQAALRLGLE